MGRRIFNEIEQECILQWLALGFMPQQIVEFVKLDFEKKCSRQNIWQYTQNQAERIKELREEIKADLQCIPFARKEVRVGQLDRSARELLRRRDHKGAAGILKQIAEETGPLVQKHEVDAGPELAKLLIDV